MAVQMLAKPPIASIFRIARFPCSTEIALALCSLQGAFSTCAGVRDVLTAAEKAIY
jgi:hypothetical protein